MAREEVEGIFDLGAHPVSETKAECGCTAVGYFETWLDARHAQFGHSEPRVGLIPCARHRDQAIEAIRRVREVWESPENLKRFEDVNTTESFLALYVEAL